MLEELFEKWAGEPCLRCAVVQAGGSNRRYYRLSGAKRTCIGVLNGDRRENEAFVYLAQYFHQRRLPVPEVYLFSDDHLAYLQQDLGDTTLYGYVYDRRRNGLGFDREMMMLYQKALDDLAAFQVAGEGIDYSMAYPRSDFDRQSMQWDLNYFKYYFLKLAGVSFDEQLLENDFQTLMDYLLQEDCSYFMYRDFQTRNIMLSADGQLHYIDFQGGRRGPAQYDVASLLYSASGNLPEVVRDDLFAYYTQQMKPQIERRGGSVQEFRERYYGFVLLRIMQAMGAYGYRGYFERKAHFLKSVPQAVANLRRVIEDHPLPIAIPHLSGVWWAIADNPRFKAVEEVATPTERLTVTINSFSYKQGIPEDPSGNGGGHVFDCRALPNPGRYPEYRSFTGRDAAVIRFFDGDTAVEAFLHNAQHIVFQSVAKYMERHFSHLMVSFGCTGGQHRSVYCAEQMARRVRDNFDCEVVVHHIEQEK